MLFYFKEHIIELCPSKKAINRKLNNDKSAMIKYKSHILRAAKHSLKPYWNTSFTFSGSYHFYKLQEKT